MSADVAEVAKLTKGQRRFLQRRYCAWCKARIDGDTCFAKYGARCTPEEMQRRREKALATYRPRPLRNHLLNEARNDD
ncbi:hypothetical protein [Sphingomonas japonica]|uniref:Uncharacterized protein n=1 Tax=Sphingomonas japonica TaxID=511662 RepID=A0ABX0U6C5_9SPHN|nr:hypothetical protein [Sphingomonas japonica]NIJ24792.1 hypothetical protein [Sphingomonas japonica]